VNLADRSALFWRPAAQSEFGGAMDGEGDDAKLTFAGNTSLRAEDKRHKRRPPGPGRACMIAGQRAAHPTACARSLHGRHCPVSQRRGTIRFMSGNQEQGAAHHESPKGVDDVPFAPGPTDRQMCRTGQRRLDAGRKVEQHLHEARYKHPR
jgi:hypothetical protein